MVVVTTLLAIGYGAHFVMNNPTNGSRFEQSNMPGGAADNGTWSIDAAFAGQNPQPPKMDFPDVGAPNGRAANPFAVPPTELTDNTEPTGSPSPYSTTGIPSDPSRAGSFAQSPPAASGLVPTPSSSNASLPSPSFAAPATTSAAASTTTAAPSTTTAAASSQPLTPPKSQWGGSVQPASFARPVNNSGFDTAWDSAKGQLQSGDLVGSFLTLSKLYDTELNNEQREQLVTILDQLAGTIIYSDEHLLEMPYEIQAGDTLTSIATRFQLSEEFLIRVNRLDASRPLTVGQQLKVVQGPFRAIIHPNRRELAVFLGRYYGGRFDVSIGRDFVPPGAAMHVTELAGSRNYFDAKTGQWIPAGHESNPIGSVWIGLSGDGGANQPNHGIHSVASGITAEDSRGCIATSQKDAMDLKAILGVGSVVSVDNAH